MTKTILVKILMDYQIIVTLVILILAIRWGKWKNWHRYYPTMLFFSLSNFVCGFVTYNYPLWEFESPLLKTTLSELLIALVFFPCTVMLYLSHFPSYFSKQVRWILFWITIYTSVEIVSYYLGFFSYHHGWNIWLSLLFNCFIFPLLYLHYKKPVFALVITILAAFMFIYYFKVPFESMK